MVDHTSIPPEVWFEIFKWATSTPRAKRFEPVDAFEPQYAVTSVYGVNTPILSMRVKCTLVRVCRAWYSLSVPLLYEYVVLNSTPRAQRLLRTIQDSKRRAEEASGQSVSYARWIQHVHIPTCTRCSRNMDFWQWLLVLLERCTNLQFLSTTLFHPLPGGFPVAIQRHVGRTLTGLSLAVDDVKDHVSPNTVFGARNMLSSTILHGFQNLRILDLSKLKLRPFRPRTGRQAPELDINTMDNRMIWSLLENSHNAELGNLTLPRLTTLMIPYTTTMLWFACTLELPDLRHLIIRAGPSEVNLHLASEMFLAKHGSGIRTLELCSDAQSAVDVTRFLQPGVCPNLDTLVYDVRDSGIALDPSVAPCENSAHLRSDIFPPLPDATAQASGSTSPTSSTASADVDWPRTALLSAPHPTLRRIALRSLVHADLYSLSCCPFDAQSHHSHDAHMRSYAHLWAILSALRVGSSPISSPTSSPKRKTRPRASLGEKSLFPRLETVRLVDTLLPHRDPVPSQPVPYTLSAARGGQQTLAWWAEKFGEVGVDLQDGQGLVWTNDKSTVRDANEVALRWAFSFK